MTEIMPLENIREHNQSQIDVMLKELIALELPPLTDQQLQWSAQSLPKQLVTKNGDFYVAFLSLTCSKRNSTSYSVALRVTSVHDDPLAKRTFTIDEIGRKKWQVISRVEVQPAVEKAGLGKALIANDDVILRHIAVSYNKHQPDHQVEQIVQTVADGTGEQNPAWTKRQFQKREGWTEPQPEMWQRILKLP